MAQNSKTSESKYQLPRPCNLLSDIDSKLFLLRHVVCHTGVKEINEDVMTGISAVIEDILRSTAKVYEYVDRVDGLIVPLEEALSEEFPDVYDPLGFLGSFENYEGVSETVAENAADIWRALGKRRAA